MNVFLPFRGHYRWDAMIGFFAARALAGVEQVRPDRYMRGVRAAGRVGCIAVTPGADGLRLVVSESLSEPAAVGVVAARIRTMFDLDADVARIERHLAADPDLAPLVAASPGLRVPGAWDPFELAVRAMLGQQITVAGARVLGTRLTAAYGGALPPSSEPEFGAVTRVFPEPARLAEATQLGLTLGMPRRRADAIVALARAVADDPTVLSPGGGLDATIARLRRLPGIGDWTAHYIAMRALREPDAFPAADIGLQRAMANASGRPTTRALLERAQPWRPWRAYAAQHLWTADAARWNSALR